MKITYVAHASLLLETNDATVAIDPWFNGPAYHNQWHVFPKPVDTSFSEKVTHVVLTHGHEDHLHFPTLSLMNKTAKVLFPYTWKSGTVEEIKELGFSQVNEAISFQKVELGTDFFVTYITNGLDAFTVFEHAGKVLLDLNDSLNASHKYFIRLFIGMIKNHWQHIHYLVCGLGGAGYFPNTVHSPLKNDFEIGKLREQFLAHKFCEIIDELKPDVVIPFVPGFALLEHDKQWINEIKFSRKDLASYYRENFNSENNIRFYPVFPGDSIYEDEWIKSSPYHEHSKDDDLSHLIGSQYAKEIEVENTLVFQPENSVDALAAGLKKILAVSTHGISRSLLQQINMVICFKDIEEPKYIHCFWNRGKISAKVSSVIPSEALLKITTLTSRLKYAIDHEWGGDVFFIGYGADIDILDQRCLKDNLDIISLRLLSRFPSASYHMVRKPLRAAKYLSANPSFAALAVRQKLATNGNPNKLPYNERSHWINKSKCDVCRLCDIPLLSDEFGEVMMHTV